MSHEEYLILSYRLEGEVFGYTFFFGPFNLAQVVERSGGSNME